MTGSTAGSAWRVDRGADSGAAHAAVRAVAIGASAGGVEALSLLLPALPAGLAVPVFVVLHLPRGSRNLLVGLFGPACAVALREPDDKDPVLAGHVYFAPPDYHLLVDRGAAGPLLALSADEPVHHSRPSIDVLFEAAADVYRAGLAAIVLTGANDDGAEGVACVKRHGGTVIVQDPARALASTMPAAAAARVTPDHVLPLDGIAAWLRALPCTGTGTDSLAAPPAAGPHGPEVRA